VHRRLSGAVLGEPIAPAYADTADRGLPARLFVYLRDPARWRDFAFLAFSGTGGLALSALPVLMLVAPVAHVTALLATRDWLWWLLVLLDGPLLVVWWLVTPALVRARATADRGILAGSRTEKLERRVEEVAASRAASLDHSAAEVRRIERDLHDGAQARIVSVGMSLGLAEELMDTDPQTAAGLLREARESAVTALSDLRSVVQGIHPPVLADRGLVGAVEALAVDLPLPVTVSSDLPGRLPDPVESAVYFAVAECLANTVKHAGAQRAWVTVRHLGGRLLVDCGDDGRGGAGLSGSGLAGVRRRLAAFDGTMSLVSPAGGPTVVSLEVPCEPSSPRTSPSSATD
jgi:signal transduction histidine kinase